MNYPGVDIGSDHDLVMTFRVRLKTKRRESQNQPRLNLRDPDAQIEITSH